MYDQLIQDQNEGAFGSGNNNDTNNNVCIFYLNIMCITNKWSYNMYLE